MQIAKSFLALVLVAATVLAQDRKPVQVSDQLGLALERALSELESCKNADKISKDEIQALKDQGKTLSDLLDNARAQITQLKAADAARADANRLDTQRIARYEQILEIDSKIIERYKTEVESLRKQRGFRIRLGAGLFFVGVIAGALATYAATR